MEKVFYFSGNPERFFPMRKDSQGLTLSQTLTA